MNVWLDGDEAVVLPDGLDAGGVDACAAGAVLCAAGFGLCTAGLGFALGLVEALAAGCVAVLAGVLVVGGAGGVVGVAGVVAPAGAETGIGVGLDPAGAGELSEPPNNASATSTIAIRPMMASVAPRRVIWPGRSRHARLAPDAAPIRPAPLFRLAPPFRPAPPIRHEA